MGAHSRPTGPQHARVSGRHRGQAAPLLDLDLTTTATRAGAVLATGATAATVVVAGAGGAFAASAAPAAAPPTPANFAALRMCESSDNYAINTGNGFYGAYQFDLGTWQGLGYGGYPYQAAPATQDQAAERLQAARGWEPWPGCSAKLGFDTTTPAASPPLMPIERVASHLPAAPAAAAPSSRTASVHVGGGVPAFSGTPLTRRFEAHKRSDVLVWQARMARRGWDIRVDGYFGPQSARVAQEFAVEKHLTASTPAGTVSAVSWSAAWTAPITH